MIWQEGAGAAREGPAGESPSRPRMPLEPSQRDAAVTVEAGLQEGGKLPPEEEEGNVEYKLKLVAPSESRLQHLVTQLKWRLREGSGEAFYEIGVEVPLPLLLFPPHPGLGCSGRRGVHGAERGGPGSLPRHPPPHGQGVGDASAYSSNSTTDRGHRLGASMTVLREREVAGYTDASSQWRSRRVSGGER